MHKDGITVAEYWTELPPKAELEQKLHAALLEARERLARRGVLLGDLDDELSRKGQQTPEIPVAALPGVGHMPAKGEDEQETARVFYVAATRVTQRLVIGVGGDGGFGKHLATKMSGNLEIQLTGKL